ncbi:MAG: ABC transporter permease [Parvularculaceae bacterium]|nr:ABC transporter permease [Parvularculaceae bacterium]
MNAALVSLAWKSLLARKLPVLLSMAAVALSVGLLISTEKIRGGVRAGFENTISGTDLVVGARTGSLNLVLYSVFRLGDPLQSVSWDTVELVAQHRDVSWVIPMSLGDSHRGYRVLGTDERYLQHYRYGEDQNLKVAQGTWVNGPAETVLGADVAKSLGYVLGDEIILSHGIVSAGFADHDEDPFTVVGILAPTGTPVDRTVHVSLLGIDAIHGPVKVNEDYRPDFVTSFLVGMKSRPTVLRFQRILNTYDKEPLTAVIPGVSLSRLWSIIGPVETILKVFTALVFIVGMVGLATTLLASLAGRKRELSILRAVGARPRDLLTILTLETVITTAGGVIVGWTLAYATLWGLAPYLRANYGLVLQAALPGSFDVLVFAAVIGIGLIAGLVPGISAYRQGLNEGLTSN